MFAPLPISRISATSKDAASLLLASDFNFGSAGTLGPPTVLTARLYICVTTACVLSLIRNLSLGTFVASSQFNLGAALTVNAGYTFVHPMRTEDYYNYKLSATSTIDFTLDAVQDGVI